MAEQPSRGSRTPQIWGMREKHMLQVGVGGSRFEIKFCDCH